MVWTKPLCGSLGRWTVQEDRKMQQYKQSEVETASYSVGLMGLLSNLFWLK